MNTFQEKSQTPHIDTALLADLCSSPHSRTNQMDVKGAIDNWINRPEAQRVLQLSMGAGGGTATSLPVEDVRDMFRLGVIALNAEKLELPRYAKKLDILRKAGLTDGDLKLPPKKAEE